MIDSDRNVTSLEHESAPFIEYKKTTKTGEVNGCVKTNVTSQNFYECIERGNKIMKADVEFSKYTNSDDELVGCLKITSILLNKDSSWKRKPLTKEDVDGMMNYFD